MPADPGDPGDPWGGSNPDEDDQSFHRGRYNPPRDRYPGGEGPSRGGPPEDPDDDDQDEDDDKNDEDRIIIPAHHPAHLYPGKEPIVFI